MLELEEARERVLAMIPTWRAESVVLSDALGRIVAEPARAPIDLPAFDNSAMDGYAVRASDLKSATAARPVSLLLCGKIPAGEIPRDELNTGSCVRIFTGSALPRGADAVVMQEDTRPAPDGTAEILFLESVKPWENVRIRGEDVKRGAGLFSPGDRISVGGAGLLAALGVREVRVSRQPLIGVMSTGDELLESGQPLVPGKIYESNRAILAPLLARAGVRPKVFPLVPDTLAATQTALEKAFGECDAVVTTGGVSVGEHDFVKNAFAELGGVMDFWKVAVRPGKPFVFGRWKEKLLFGLPGNPVSALVTFLLLVRPALLRWQGAANIDLPTIQGCLAEPLANQGERRHFMRMAVDAAGTVRSAGFQSSHILSSLAKANGLVDVPARTALRAGAIVSVLQWE